MTASVARLSRSTGFLLQWAGLGSPGGREEQHVVNQVAHAGSDSDSILPMTGVEVAPRLTPVRHIWAWPRMAANGVRSSWLASDTNRRNLVSDSVLA